MRSALFSAENLEKESNQPGMRLQNSKMLKIELNGECMARTGAMVAYQGQIQFQALGSGGLGKFLKQKLTGEGVPLMKLSGRGDVFLADMASDVHIVDLEPGDALSINGSSVLAFDSTLQYDIKMVQGAGMFGGGLFNSVFTGTGRLAITCDGPPIVIPVAPNQPVFVDTDAVIGWSANLQSSIQKSQSLGSMLRGGSGEVFQLALNGQGFVIVQPSEGPAGPQQQKGGGLLGGLGG
jgi:uncharacterized protein (AIM24 family)